MPKPDICVFKLEQGLQPGFHNGKLDFLNLLNISSGGATQKR